MKVFACLLAIQLLACDFEQGSPVGQSGASGGSASAGSGGSSDGTLTTGGGGIGGMVAGGNCSTTGGGPPRPPSVFALPEWSQAIDPVEPSDCSAIPTNEYEPQDECACNDLTCAPGESCILVFEPPPSVIGGPGSDFNGCFPLCESDDDCQAPSVCVGNSYGLMVCKAVECRVSEDCAADACGQCVDGYRLVHVGTQPDPSASRCWYLGSCGADVCQGCYADSGWHNCAP